MVDEVHPSEIPGTAEYDHRPQTPMVVTTEPDTEPAEDGTEPIPHGMDDQPEEAPAVGQPDDGEPSPKEETLDVGEPEDEPTAEEAAGEEV